VASGRKGRGVFKGVGRGLEGRGFSRGENPELGHAI